MKLSLNEKFIKIWILLKIIEGTKGQQIWWKGSVSPVHRSDCVLHIGDDIARNSYSHRISILLRNYLYWHKIVRKVSNLSQNSEHIFYHGKILFQHVLYSNIELENFSELIFFMKVKNSIILMSLSVLITNHLNDLKLLDLMWSEKYNESTKL